MDFEDVSSSLEIRQAELDLSVQSSRPQEGRIQSVRTIRGHEYLHIAAGIEAVELVHYFKHCALHLVVSMSLIATAGTTDGIHLIDKEDASLLGSRQLEKLADHTGSFSNIPLHQLRANDADEASIRSVCDSPSGQCLACAWRSVQEYTLWRIDAQGYKPLRLKQRHLNDFAQALQLVLGTAHVVVGNIWLFLHCHHRDGWVNLWWQRDLDLVFASV
mmetsp:Transcript_39259/g.92428  ORF Transcript_39259/g.92428 Transcript_39259/m.92428 type:complete len:217 (+) Transcript_39259:385-1035(+)